MNLNNIHNVYFIGIGGIGMSALARYFSKIGKHVAGYDKTKTEVTSNLEKNGIQIHFSDAVASIPKKFQNKNVKNSVAASDAFFPFADGIETLIKAGIKIIVQPGGSIRDGEVISAANKAKVKMVFTGTRHFNH